MGEPQEPAFERNLMTLAPYLPPADEVITYEEYVGVVKALGSLSEREGLVLGWLADGDNIQAVAGTLRRPVWYTHRIAQRAFRKVFGQLNMDP